MTTRLAAAQPLPPPPSLDADQSAAVRAITAGAPAVRVIGAPGTGKTTVAVAAAAAAVDSGVEPNRVLVLAPTREAAARLRDQISATLARATGEPMARSAASAAFAVLTAVATQREEPPPSLISGPEQDVMLREILDGHRRGDGHVPDWSGVVAPEATALQGFRDELRNLLMRAAEAGLGPEDLHDLGERAGRPEWRAAARVMIDYANATVLRSLTPGVGARFDPAEVIAAAADALDRWDEVAAGPMPSWDLVIVDDFHDATAATADLLRVLAGAGSRIALIGNADQSVQGYRGAAPPLVRDAVEGAGDVVEVELRTRHRGTALLSAVAAGVAQGLGVIARASAREAYRRSAVPDGASADVRVITAPHRYGQSRAIAAELRRARRATPELTPWSQMAVVARSKEQLRSLRSDLMAAQIPCEHLGDGTALHQEPGIRPLLVILECALGREWTEDLVVEVLTSRVGGLDAVGLRRLRRALVTEERAAHGARSSGELLVDAMADPWRWRTVAVPEAASAAAVSRAVAAAATRAHEPRATPGTVIWAAWNALGIAQTWHDAAVAGSARDDADLDAVIALMRAAQTFTERLPDARIGAFLDYLTTQDFAPDSLAARGAGSDGVVFTTPAAAAGREWDVVVVAGVEERAWPDLRLRDSVLGAQVLADVLAGRQDLRAPRDLHSARAAVLDDETRAFLVAVTRARRNLIVTAVDDGESRPSRFVAAVERAAGVTRVDGAASRGVADLRGAVAKLRSGGGGEPDATDDETMSRVDALARLAILGVPGAHPDGWHGVPEVSTTEPIWSPEDVVRVSPSKVDTVRTCAVKWALETVGGVMESTRAQDVGTLVHEIAAELPAGTESELLAELERRWPRPADQETWVEQLEHERARGMMSRFAAYVATHTSDEVRVESRFAVDIDRARLAGSADRVEITDGTARIVDLKTGRRIPAAEAADHGQLLMYQLAAASGAFENVDGARGAALVFVGADAARAGSVVEQHPIEVSHAHAVLTQVVEDMTAATFVATPNPLCDHCPVRRACPAHASGDQVTDL